MQCNPLGELRGTEEILLLFKNLSGQIHQMRFQMYINKFKKQIYRIALQCKSTVIKGVLFKNQKYNDKN